MNDKRLNDGNCILALISFAAFTDCKTSAVSPLKMAIKSEVSKNVYYKQEKKNENEKIIVCVGILR
ncbi:MAG: hypothetical protein WAM14_14220 [Candidatus Nitrosopolaris sp.]